LIKPEENIHVSTRITPVLNERLNLACKRTGLKKQAIIAAGLRRILPELIKRKVAEE
jgi:hypothetical protein